MVLFLFFFWMQDINLFMLSHLSQIVLSLVPRQGGELRVVGIAYNLGTSSVAQNSTPAPVGNDISLPSSTGSSAAKPSYISTICVRGKQRLEVQGPRLNVSKEEKTGKVYGPDRRLDLVVQEEMPILNVSVCRKRNDDVTITS